MKINSKFIDKLLSFGETLSKVVVGIQSRDFEVSYKENHSPLTEADTTSNDMILNFYAQKLRLIILYQKKISLYLIMTEKIGIIIGL